MTADRDQRRILHRCDVESLGLIEKQRKGNLMQPADEMAGHFEQAPIILQFPHWRSQLRLTKSNRASPTARLTAAPYRQYTEQ